MGQKTRAADAAPPTLPIAGGAHLRALRRRHARALFAEVDANRDRLREWLPWLDVVTEQAHVVTFVQETEHLHALGVAARWAIVQQGRIGGVASLENIDRMHRHAHIGYWLGGAYEGRGLMTSAVAAMCRYGFEDLGLNRIELRAAVGNRRSRAIPERLGFSQEGIARDYEWLYDRYIDAVVYSLLAREWPAACARIAARYPSALPRAAARVR